MNYDKLSDHVKKFVLSFYKSREDERFTYHNLEHTENVVHAVKQIAGHYQLNDEDHFAVVTAAWFHDTGYTGNPENHEERGVTIAMDFLKDSHLEAGVLSSITNCILATKLPQSPKNILESIICDADFFHFGSDEFLKKSKQLRKEINTLYNAEISKEEWRQKTITLLTGHEFHTDYCRVLLDSKKEDNIKRLIKPGDGIEDNIPKAMAGEETIAIEGYPIIKDKNNKERLLKGVDTMFKITSNNHQRLSNMADSKAHIMISVNAIIISLLISLLLRQLDKYEKMAIPAMMLLVVNLVTIVFAILATRPTIPKGTFTEEDIEHQNVNLLFFGNFFKMDLDIYNKGMKKMINDQDFLYNSLIRDVYAQGIVLGRKYRLLRTSYNVFMFGLVVSVIAFVIASLR